MSFLVRPKDEFPNLVEKYRDYCEENDLNYSDPEYQNFSSFFRSFNITIRVEDQEDQFLSVAINYGPELDQNYPEETRAESRNQAEVDAVYLGFQLLNQMKV